MERKFKTLIKETHKHGMNEYVHGRISGYKEVMCDGVRNGFDEPGFAFKHVPGIGSVHTTVCEPEQYEKFKDLVEKHYPGLCEFNYQEG